MKRLLILCLTVIIAAIAGAMMWRTPSQITLVDAKAFATAGSPSMVMVGLTIENAGAPDVLLSASSPAAGMITLANPGHGPAALVVPGQGDGILAMDGAHVMLRSDGFAEGGFIPLTLRFQNAGDVTTRVFHAGTSTMSHGARDGVALDPAPGIRLIAPQVPDATGFGLKVEVENFTFRRAADDAPHEPGIGHAHLYLNGLKLGRLYEPQARIGALRSGDYVLEIGLNTNDHRLYLDANRAPVVASMRFTIAD